MTVLRLVMGDQLSRSLSSLVECDPVTDVILMCEIRNEATYVKHHKKKIVFLFSAMRHFADELRTAGFKVHYVTYDDAENTGSFVGEVERAYKLFNLNKVVVHEPSEYRVMKDVQSWQEQLQLEVEIRADERFLCSHEDFQIWAKGRKQLRMEYFYREIRKRFDLLMEGEQPTGGQWNYDQENRKPPKEGLVVPATFHQAPDPITQEVIELVQTHFEDHFGDVEPFFYAVTREQALAALDKFIKERLPDFGIYQDAMVQGEAWMFHSHISLYINAGMLLPLECAQAAQNAYLGGEIPLNAAEGFIRQIIGWREYVRGVYWLKMPGYGDENFFGATRNLPLFYWSGQTHMNCFRQCVLETKENAYAHHIQRLMVLGNFALLAGIDPKQVNEWFLIVYADAFEWVELTNVSGMALYADGGFLASKPYAAGGAYINKMSTYCAGCRYKVTKKNGPTACPFNYLYWDFLDRHRALLSDNPRVAMMYRTLDRMSDEKIAAVRDDSLRFLGGLE